MKLKDLISPKWKHSNPAVRLKAVKNIDNSNITLLEEILSADTNAGIRHAVIQKLSDKTILENAASTDNDETVKNAALNKLYRIYADEIYSLDDNRERLSLLDRIKDEEIIFSLALRIDNPEFRVAIVSRLSDPKRLCEMTESNCGVKAGRVIIDKIADVKLLERIAQNASGKKIRKMAMEKIDSLKPKKIEKREIADTSDDHLPEIETLCISLEKASESVDLKELASLIEKAETTLAECREDKNHPLIIKLGKAVEVLKQLLKHIEKEDNETRKLKALTSELKELSGQSSFNKNDKQRVEAIVSQCAAIDITDELIRSEFINAQTEFDENYDLFTSKQEDDKKRTDALRAIIEKVESLSKTDDVSSLEALVQAVVDEWNRLYFKSEETDVFEKSFKAAVETCRKKITAYIEAEKLKIDEIIKGLLEKVREASEKTGNTLFKEAAEVKNIISQWKSLNTVDEKDNNEFNQLCDIFFEKLGAHRKNRDWEYWANLGLKTELCEKVAKTADEAEKAEELYGYADIIREAQKNWKEIGPVSREKSDEIWDRFKSACDRVFTLGLKEKNILFEKAKETVELENLNEASKLIIDIQQQWKQIGSLPLALEKDLRDSFNQICNSFFEKKRNFIQQKDSERNENYDLKADLCEQAESLAGEPTSNQTTEKYKKLQARWKEIGAVPRDKSDAIWERFSLACNTYFDTLELSKPENLEIKKNLFKDAETVLTSVKNGEDIWDACKQAISLQKTWNETGPVPKDASDTLWKQFRAICDEIFAVRDEVQAELSKDYDKNLLEKEGLIEQAVALSDSNDWKATADGLKSIQEKWKETGPAARKDEQELWARFRQINDEFFNRRRDHFNERDAERKDNLAIKEDLCLTLELLAKVAMDRSGMEYNKDVPLAEQLSKARDLRDSIVSPGDEKATRSNVMSRVKEIQAQWKDTGPVPSDKDNGLWERYKKAVDLFYSN